MLVDISLPLGLGVRELQSHDEVFAEALFFSAREHLYQMPITKAQVDLLIKQQFILQQASYSASFPLAEKLIVLLFDEPIGKLILNKSPDSLHIVDVVFLPLMRGKGYGTMLLRALKNIADTMGVPLRLAVDRQNIRAKKLYLSLGFALIESSGTHDMLSW